MTNRLSGWGPAAVWAGVLFFLSSLSGLDGSFFLGRGEDKAAHAVLYAVLGATLAWGRNRATPPPPGWIPVCLGVLYGASDEWHQSFVAGRDPSVGDWAADTAGVLAGYWITSLMVRRWMLSGGERRPHETTPGQQPE